MSNYPVGTTVSKVHEFGLAEYGNKDAIIYYGRKITHQELDDFASKLAFQFEQMGVKEGVVVSIILPNIPQIMIANLACYKLGAVTSLHNPRSSSRELEAQFRECHPRLVVALDSVIPKVAGFLSEAVPVVGCHISDFLPKASQRWLFSVMKPKLFRKFEKGVIPFVDLLEAKGKMTDDRSCRESTMALLYTSGTTGKSKGVVIKHSNAVAGMEAFEERYVTGGPLVKGEETLLGIYPMYHSAGFAAVQNFTLWFGWTMILLPLPTADVILGALKKYTVTCMTAVATIYAKLLGDKRFRKMDFSRIKGYFSGASPFPKKVIEGMTQLVPNFKILDVYGLTETTAFLVSQPPFEPYKDGSVGKPFPNTYVKIMDLKDPEKEVGIGERGVVWARGPQVSGGYYHRPEETEKNFRDGWLNTGDIGYLDPDGYVFLCGRAKEMIIHSGFNVYPQEVEEVIKAHPAVADVCVVGRPDEVTGESVRAVVVCRSGMSITQDELRDYCKQQLSPYKVPSLFKFVEVIPTNENGKVSRKDIDV